MPGKFIRFVVRLLVFAAILALAGYVLSLFLPEGAIAAMYYYILLFFLAVTAAVHFVLLRVTRLSPRKFVAYFMFTTLIKLVIYFVVVLIYAFSVKTNLIPFILYFFILYILFTVFEVVSLLSQTRDQR